MNAVIIDDELNARLALKGILEENFPEVIVKAECKNVPEAVRAIHLHQPLIIFLDISMPDQSGLELFQYIEDTSKAKVIFVTAHSQFAVQAFSLSAIDYLLKPIKIEDLKRAINKVENSTMPMTPSLGTSTDKIQKIALNTGEGITFLDHEDIIYLKADGSYTEFFITNSQKIIVSKKISTYEKFEQLGTFIRIHRSHMINYTKITKILKQDGGQVVMINGDILPISTDKKQILLDKFEAQRF